MDGVYYSFTRLVIVIMCVTFYVAGLDKLGKHKPPSGGARVLGERFPHPGVFFHHFVNPGKPLLMKNVLNATQYRAYVDWTDQYLRSRYGGMIVEVEEGRKENRSRGAGEMQLSKYLDIYETSDLYLVHTVPKVMQDEVQLPYTLQCGGYQDNIHEAVIWFSGGNTKSLLHYDSADNIICLLDGKKQFVMIDKKYKDLVEAEGFVQDGVYSTVDVDAVDPNKFPGIMAAPWLEAKLTSGDCLYIPYQWYHQVNSSPGRNLAMNIWFSHLWWFNKTDCDDMGTSLKPFSDYKVASSNQQLRTHMLAPFVGLDHVTLADFLEKVDCSNKEDTKKIWAMIDMDEDSKLTWSELYTFSMDDVVRKFPECFHVGEDEEEDDDSDPEELNSENTNLKVETTSEQDGNDDQKDENLSNKAVNDDQIVEIEDLVEETIPEIEENVHIVGNIETEASEQIDEVKENDEVNQSDSDNKDRKDYQRHKQQHDEF